MAPYAAKLTDLERVVRPLPESSKESGHHLENLTAPTGLNVSMWAPMETMMHTDTDKDDFTLVDHADKGKKVKGKAKANACPRPQTLPINARTNSYVSAALVAASTRQPTTLLKPVTHTLTITEVMVI